MKDEKCKMKNDGFKIVKNSIGLMCILPMLMMCSCTTVRHFFGISDVLTPAEAAFLNEVNDAQSNISSSRIKYIYVTIDGEDPKAWVLKRLNRRCSQQLLPASACINKFGNT
jgi:hypothetical protein